MEFEQMNCTVNATTSVNCATLWSHPYLDSTEWIWVEMAWKESVVEVVEVDVMESERVRFNDANFLDMML